MNFKKFILLFTILFIGLSCGDDDDDGLVEIEEADRTDDEVDELARNERHIQLKMAITQFVSGLSVDEKAKIDALKL